MRLVNYDFRLENDDAILRHELGHALVWLHYCGAIGRLQLCRQPNSDLLASVRFGPMSESITQLQYEEAYAVRLLAGEIAARRFLNLPDDQITCVVPLSPTVRESQVLWSLTDDREDIVKVLQLSCRHAGDAWFSWLEKRHAEARRIVDAGWNTIDAAAQELRKHLPSEPRATIFLPGLWLIKRLEDDSAVTGTRKPVEALHKQILGNYGMRLYRFYRLRMTKSLSVFEDPGD